MFSPPPMDLGKYIIRKSGGLPIQRGVMWFHWVTAGTEPRLWEIQWTNIRPSRAQRNRVECLNLIKEGPAKDWHTNMKPITTSRIRIMCHYSCCIWEDLKLNGYSGFKSVTSHRGMWVKGISSGCCKSCLCASEGRRSVIQGGLSLASGLSAMTEGWKTHLEVGHSQLRQTVHIRTQDFVFSNFQWLSVPLKQQRKKHNE